MKVCTNCKYYLPSKIDLKHDPFAQSDTCEHPNAVNFTITNLVRGINGEVPTTQKSCYTMRDISYYCGSDATLFEAKP